MARAVLRETSRSDDPVGRAVDPCSDGSTRILVRMRSCSPATWLITPTMRPPARSASELVHGQLQRIGVERPEPLVDEERLHADPAGVLLDRVGDCEREGEGGLEGLSARQGGHVAFGAGVRVEDPQVEPGRRPGLSPRCTDNE